MKVRNDKNPDQASSAEFLAHMWRSQENLGRRGGHVDEGDLIEPDWHSDASDEDSSAAL